MSNKLATICLVAGMTVALAAAQWPGPRGENATPPDPQTMIARRVSFLAAQLNLTDDQKAKATTIFTNAYAAGQSIQESLRSNRQPLADAVKSNNTAQIDSLATAAGVLTGQLTAINSKAEAAFYVLLTAEQKTKYDATPRGGGPRGGGGMGPARFRTQQ